MKKLPIVFIFAFVLICFSVTVEAGLMVGEGSVTLVPFEKKKMCGGVCVYSTVDYTTTTYSVAVSEDLEKFVDRIEPQDFTLIGINCPWESEPRRECIRNLCSQESTESTQTVCIYFSAPLEFAFEMENGLPVAPKEREYGGGIRAIGKVGAATMVEPLSFSVFYTPFNGWLIIEVIIILVVIIVIILFVKLKHKKRKKSNLRDEIARLIKK